MALEKLFIFKLSSLITPLVARAINEIHSVEISKSNCFFNATF